MGYVLEKSQEQIESETDFHEPMLKNVDGDGEFEFDNSDITNFVTASEPKMTPAANTMNEFTSIFYEGNCASKCAGKGCGNAQAGKGNDTSGGVPTPPPSKPEPNKSEKPMQESALMESIELI